MRRDQALNKAKSLVTGDRAKDYGNAYDNHARIALKIARLVQNEKHTDSWIDICGYGSLGSENGKEKQDKK